METIVEPTSDIAQQAGQERRKIWHCICDCDDFALCGKPTDPTTPIHFGPPPRNRCVVCDDLRDAGVWLCSRCLAVSS